jgi:hypothetical protein
MATAASVDWHGTIGKMERAIADYGKRLLAAVYRLASEWATRIADDARAGAPWTNRTGNARRQLFGRAVRLAMGAVIIIGHGVPYGVFLERRWAGRFAAIMPALQRAHAAVMQSLQALVGA